MIRTERTFIFILCSVLVLIFALSACKPTSGEKPTAKIIRERADVKSQQELAKTNSEALNKVFDYRNFCKLLLDQFNFEYIHHSPNFTYVEANADDFLSTFSIKEQHEHGLSILEIAEEAIRNLSPDLDYTIVNNGKSIFIQLPNYEFELTFSQFLPRLVIVMDDMGEDIQALEYLIKLLYPVTVSIIPSTAHAEEVARIAYLHNLEVFLHQPMQALDFKNKQELRLDSSQEEIEQVLAENISKLKYVSGINNHTGSKFTSDLPSVTRFLNVINKDYKDLIILDSLTYGKSVLYNEAQKLNLETYVRDIFLDNVLDIPLIIKELNKSAQLAQKNGQAVVICHPHKQTLAALHKWQVPEGVRVVQLWQLRYNNENF